MRWGCDAPADRPVFEHTCPECWNTRDDCPTCEGRGAVRVYRCPSQAIDREMQPFLTAYREVVQRNAWPAEGTWRDQAAIFVEMVRIADLERGVVERERAEKEKAEMEAKQRAARGAGR